MTAEVTSESGAPFFKNPRFWGLVTIVAVGVLLRLVPHPPNFSPLAGLALFAGATFSRRLAAVLVPLLVLFLSDLIIGFHETMAAVYASFVVVACLGFWLRGHTRSIGRLGLTAVTGSVLFFLLTNFAVWALQVKGMYPLTFGGLMTCYAAALPFFQNALVGDLVFTGVFFGAWALIEKSLPALRAA